MAPVNSPFSIVARDIPAVSPRKRQQFLIVAGVILAFAASLIATVCFTFGPLWLAVWNYQPQEGDVVFQSLPATPIVEAIEGATRSPLSHCGIVGRNMHGKWVVYEAYHRVEATPLTEFLGRGRYSGFAVYRLKPTEQSYVPAMMKYVQQQVGKPYDDHYTWDEEAIYCSELIYKAYAAAANGKGLGKTVTLGELNWKPFRELIERKEDGVPVGREMITPRDLAAAEQLELVTKFAIDVR